MIIFHKTKIKTVILRCLMSLTLNRYKSYFRFVTSKALVTSEAITFEPVLWKMMIHMAKNVQKRSYNGYLKWTFISELTLLLIFLTRSCKTVKKYSNITNLLHETFRWIFDMHLRYFNFKCQLSFIVLVGKLVLTVVILL